MVHSTSKTGLAPSSAGKYRELRDKYTQLRSQLGQIENTLQFTRH
ncbi:MAG TPA: hypothetical protein PKE57_01035 [Cellvibrionaceae bacterium]|nr:hypothetical protein [Cellvibrionaceae bacterium]HMW49395.1 hypothetical protein [Cellvibrionaceae bacterium]HMW71900.1 hypothetical protein [Cellvibrionaceae bacterium]HMY40733.1 hypothetical protein [Marinagarivorans sp.]HNG60813.1 hypothetical protein [Cellvibrionaceae bacterium]